MPDSESEELAEAASDGTSARAGTGDEEAQGVSEDAVTSATTRFEDGARSFLELEDELDDAAEATRARVVDAETIPTADVPADYPRSIDSDRALAVGLAFDGPSGDGTAYFAWPPDADGPLERLLSALDISRSSFADLNGRRLLVTVEDGHVHPLVPPTPPRGSPYGLYGVLGGHAVNLALVVGAIGGQIGAGTLVLGFLLVNLIALPAATYLDASHLRTRTDFDHAPSFWTLLQALIGVNVLVTAAYLRLRRRARPLAVGE